MDRTTYPFYEELDALLGTRAASTPTLLLESSSSSTASCPETNNDAPTASDDGKA